MNFANIILSTIIDNSGASAVAGETASSSGWLGLGAVGTVLYILLLIGVFYFFAIKPQKKKEEEIKLLQSNLAVNDYVVLDSGIYGKIKEVTDSVFIIEMGMNKNILVPVLKSRVIGKGEPNLTNTKK